MAELLIKATDWHQYDDLNAGQFNQLPQRKKDSYARRLRQGDIIAILPDGATWGTKDTLPAFVKIKIPGLSLQDAADYQDIVFGSVDEIGEPIATRMCRYQLPGSIVQSIIDSGDDFLVVATQGGFEAVLTDHG